MTIKQKLRQLILKLAKPVLIWIGHFNFIKYFFGATYSIEYEPFIKSFNLMNGDAILSRTDYNATNMLIEGYWKHVGMIDLALNPSKPHVIEATAKGVIRRSLEDFLEDKSQVMPKRPIFCGADARNDAVKFATSLIGSPYDWAVISDNEGYYCSEVIWKAYDEAVKPSPFEPRETLGVLTVTPEDIALANRKWVKLSKI